MEYWEGQMNWPIDEKWVCETCGEYHGLEWGLVNGECRCNNCHIHYMMRDGDTILTKPKSLLKDEYKEPIRKIYDKYHVPYDEMTDEMLDEFMDAPSLNRG